LIVSGFFVVFFNFNSFDNPFIFAKTFVFFRP